MHACRKDTIWGGQLGEAASATIASLGIPPGVHETIRYGLRRLSADCQRMLGVASVAGRDFDAELLRRSASALHAGPADPDRTLDVLDEAVAAGLIGPLADGVARYRFSHVLIRDALYEYLPASQRVRMHRAIGEAVEDLFRDQLEAHFAALAHHFFAAIPSGTAAKAVAYAVEAAQRSARLLAYEDAVAHYQLALRALDARCEGSGGEVTRLAPDATLQRIDILIALGEEQHHSGNPTEARDTLAEAARRARELRHAERLAEAAVAYFGPGEWRGDVDRAAIDLLEHALVALPPHASALRVRVLGRLATAFDWAGNHQRPQALREEALRLAERLGDSAPLGEALSELHMGMFASSDLTARLEVATRIVSIAEASGLKALAMSGYFWCFLDSLQAGDMTAADRALQAYTTYAESTRQAFARYRAKAMQVMRLLLSGRFSEAETAASEALAAGTRAQSPNAMLIYAVHLWTLRRDQGRLHEIEAGVREFVDQYPTVPATRAALALLYAEIGREAEARVEFEQLAAHDFADVARDVNWVNFLEMTAQVCVFLGDAARAATLYDLLLPYAEHTAVVGFGDACHGAVARSLGLLATTLSRWDAAARHFEDALAINARMGARPYLARTQHQYAELLLRWQPKTGAQGSATSSPACPAGEPVLSSRRHIEGDRGEGPSGGGWARGLSLLDEAIATYEQLGMQTALAPARELREQALGQQQAAARNVFRFDGKRWVVVWRGEPVHVRKAPALHYLAYLLRHPGRWISIIDLQRAVTLATPSAAVSPDDHLEVIRPGEGEPVLDARALRACRARLRELRDERGEARRLNDAARLAAIDAEREAIERQLRRGNVGNAIDQLRKNVSKAIVRARAAIRRPNASLGDHLEECIAYERHAFRYDPPTGIRWDE